MPNTLTIHPSSIDAIVEHETRRWGHPLDSLDRAAIAVVLADQYLKLVAGIDEDTENGAYRVQTAALNAWDAEIKSSVKACAHPEMDYVWIADTSYGGAVSAVKAYTRSIVERFAEAS